ncbi:hypothetical protein PpBr36_02235 [Pyricularia pennisetigena]|uniref:hypothetical protein n=1 Tax=Pyricularia pennisetigena TaxID=1578925 RepID=UPI00114FDFE2|nr:hypothetical protein PpBr36_02235 [Pyricularia pennisetigena]TLS30770.1 hypothetical protein PpBr36_02235 [Pyricularia pennisetigena]
MADSAPADSVVGDSPAPNAPAADVEMTESASGAAEGDQSALPYAGEDGPEEPAPARIPFFEYLTSPVVTLMVGSASNSDTQTILTAHQALLTQSPYFATLCADFDNSTDRHIDLSNEDVDAVGCFLEYLYTGDYFPRKIPGQRQLEQDPALPAVDDSGDQLLKHARVYTIAEKFQMPSLRHLASSKIHCVNSTAKGEIAYARYVYQYIPKEDSHIRAPIVTFWAQRSHTLRAEAEEEFRSLCLEFPQFGYDVLTRVLDEKLKREQVSKMHPATASGRKRPRHSNV